METADEILRLALNQLGIPENSRKGFDARYEGDVLSVRIPSGERVEFPSTDRVTHKDGLVGAVVRELQSGELNKSARNP